MDSILISVKKLLGITSDYNHFDADIIMHINSVFMILHQLGVGPDEGFTIKDQDAKWSDFISGNNLEAVKSYMHLRVKMLFDPPLGSAHMEAITRSINELEWRLKYSAESEV